MRYIRKEDVEVSKKNVANGVFNVQAKPDLPKGWTTFCVKFQPKEFDEDETELFRQIQFTKDQEKEIGYAAKECITGIW